jgi:hypothetical protein
MVRIAIKDQKDVTILGLEHLQESGRKNALESLLEGRDGEYQAALADFNAGEFYGYMCDICPLMWWDVLRSKCGVYRGKGAFEGSARH